VAAHEHIETLYKLRAPALGSYLRRCLGEADLARDTLQEVFIRLLRYGRLDQMQFPKAYLFLIAAHVVCEIKRREKRIPVMFDSTAVDHAAAAEASIETDFEAASEAGAVLGALPPLRAAVLLLRLHEGMSYAEIASALGISVHTVKKYLRLALLHCRQSAGAERRNTPKGKSSASGRQL